MPAVAVAPCSRIHVMQTCRPRTVRHCAGPGGGRVSHQRLRRHPTGPATPPPRSSVRQRGHSHTGPGGQQSHCRTAKNITGGASLTVRLLLPGRVLAADARGVSFRWWTSVGLRQVGNEAWDQHADTGFGDVACQGLDGEFGAGCGSCAEELTEQVQSFGSDGADPRVPAESVEGCCYLAGPDRGHDPIDVSGGRQPVGFPVFGVDDPFVQLVCLGNE